MFYHLIPVPISVALIILYYIARKEDNLRLVAIIQPLTSFFAIVIALLSLLTPNAVPGFTFWIVSGLGVSLVGDINNIDMTHDRVLIIGLILFVTAYLTYAVGLTIYNNFQSEDIYIAIILLVIYAGSMVYLWPGLGECKVPVMIYGLVLPFLLSRALSTFFGAAFSVYQSLLLSLGTGMLYLGDFEFGIHRFRKQLPFMLGPFLYAGGQLLISLSPSYF